MNNEERRFQAAVAAMKQLLIPENFVGVIEGAFAKKMDIGKALAMTCIDLADALLAELDRATPETKTHQPDGFPDFQKWTAYEGLGTIKEGEEDIFAHRNLSSLTERHNRVIAAFREWAGRQAKSPQPDADGWIPHKPGDPMPCHEETMCRRKYRNGKIGIRDRAGNYSWVDWSGGEHEIIAWKPA